MSDLAALQPLDEHNRLLQSRVHPTDWTNPTPDGPYNVVIVGAGTAGLVTAGIAASLGAKTALIERSLMGGDCLNVGCVPSKALIRSARCVAEVRDAAGYGVNVDRYTVDFPKVMERLRSLRAGISPADSAVKFRDHYGADVYIGDATFTGADSLTVVGDDGAARELTFAKAAICTGARAAAPPIDGLKEAGYLDNETVFSLTELPESLIVLGGGPIGSELAQCFARFGTKVTLLERGPRILSHDDPDAAAVVQAALARDGVQVRTETEADRVAATADGKTVHFKGGGSVTAAEILVGVGRQPNVDGLGLEAAGVEYDLKTGVSVNDSLQTSNPKIYAAGDVCSKLKFTHAADFLARTLIRTAVAPRVPLIGGAKASELVIPWCTYTSPELAHVGLTPQRAREQGVEIDTLEQPFAEVDRAILESPHGEPPGFARVHLKKGTDEIVGATVVSDSAGELISQFSLAMTHGIGLSKFAATIYPYPTQAEAVRKLGDAYNRGRLTPTAKKALGAWFKWTR
ncbi:mercuric reductase [Alienimonas californiensis]|uniref:Mercuric reductase n=1 Tax=Alienimonas californiensis TaxID=2527989 RepID=A0A517P4Z7_9PLAN|nr:mercuric reductase [Alienimonas californiensis]QDT14457.1 Mercuric reductase [Alienimonas californiensis]